MSKNWVVALTIALNILLCKAKEAPTKTDTNEADLMKVIAIVDTVKTAKTVTQVPREIGHDNNS